MTEHDPLPSLPFDHFQRYDLTRRILTEVTGREPVRILDVGGHGSSLKHFLPDAEVVVVDPSPPPQFSYRAEVPFLHDGYVIGSGTTLPFGDDTVDIVTAHDTLEHVPPQDRERFLAEMLRVSRRIVIVNGPVASEEASRAEKRLDEFGKNVIKIASGPLTEHLAHGLPRSRDIAEALRRGGHACVGMPNGNVYAWFLAMIVKHYLMVLPGADAIHDQLDRVYNEVLSPVDLAQPCYREAFIVAKGLGDEELQDVAAAVTSHAARNAPDVAALEPLVRALEEHAVAAARRLQEPDVPDHEPHRATTRARRLAVRAARRMAPRGTRRANIVAVGEIAMNMARAEGTVSLLRRLPRVRRWWPLLSMRVVLNSQYADWVRMNAPTEADAARMRAEISTFEIRPLISVITPVYNTPPEWLIACIESVRHQVYPHWELCLADDASPSAETASVLDRYDGVDPRIKTRRLEKNRGIAGASNAALELATGDFVALLDHDDELRLDAFFHIVKRLNAQPDLDYLYTDEDKRNPDGRLVEPFFKPGWSPDLLLSENYLTHLSVIRKALIDRVGGFRSGYDGSQDYDLLLRVTEATDRIGHVAQPLYTWRKIPGSAAGSSAAKPYAYDAAVRALQSALERRGVDARVVAEDRPGRYRIRYTIEGTPRVSIVIATKDQGESLRRCVESVRSMTIYDRYEIVIVDNGTQDPATLAWLDEHDGPVVRQPGRFNFPRLVNAGAAASTGDFLLLLKSNTEAVHDGWLQALLEHAQRPEVGAVGARLLHPYGRLRHEGILVDEGDLPRNLDSGGYFGLDNVVRNVRAVSAACMMLRRDVFARLGGFDEAFSKSYHDVDFCLRAQEARYRIVYTPYASLTLHERATSGHKIPDDAALFRSRWSSLGPDPYYNPNLDLRHPFWLKVPGRGSPGAQSRRSEVPE